MTTTETRTLHVFLTRGLVAVAWSIVFAETSGDLTGAITVGAGILLVLYPLIDVVGTRLDARTQRGSERLVLLANPAVSSIAAVAPGIAATGTAADILAVFADGARDLHRHRRNRVHHPGRPARAARRVATPVLNAS